MTSAFYRRNETALLRFLARQVYDPQLALDLTAEAFAQAFIGRRRFRGASRGEEAAWLQTIARRQLSRYWRRGRIERDALNRLGIDPSDISAEELERVEELAGLAEARDVLREALRVLSEDQRRALELRIVRELPYPEVADALGVTEDTARARVSRALRALRRAIPNELAIEEQT